MRLIRVASISLATLILGASANATGVGSAVKDATAGIGKKVKDLIACMKQKDAQAHSDKGRVTVASEAQIKAAFGGGSTDKKKKAKACADAAKTPAYTNNDGCIVIKDSVPHGDPNLGDFYLKLILQEEFNHRGQFGSGAGGGNPHGPGADADLWVKGQSIYLEFEAHTDVINDAIVALKKEANAAKKKQMGNALYKYTFDMAKTYLKASCETIEDLGKGTAGAKNAGLIKNLKGCKANAVAAVKNVIRATGRK